MKHKFKVGDKVIITKRAYSDNDLSFYVPYHNSEFDGQMGVVTKVKMKKYEGIVYYPYYVLIASNNDSRKRWYPFKENELKKLQW